MPATAPSQSSSPDRYPDLDRYRIDSPERINSPGLIIFKSLLEHNLDEMVRVAGDPNRLCPHCKTHKTAEIIHLWLERGVSRHKCATIAEAEMLATAGVEDILIAYQMVGPNLSRLMQLAGRFPRTQFTTLVDSPFAVQRMSDALSLTNRDSSNKQLDASPHAAVQPLTIGLMLDLDSGMHRTGIPVGSEAIELYEMIEASDHVVPAGLHWYDGHHRQPDLNERTGAVLAGWERLTRFRDQLMLSGLTVPRVVAAGTGSFAILADQGEPNLLLSPGTTVLHDDDMLTRFPELNLIPAQGILTRIISRSQPGHLTLDAGHKACAADQPFGQRLYFPHLGPVEEVLHSEEHLVIKTPLADQFRLGDPLIAISRHACPVSALYQTAHVIEDGQCVAHWEPIARNRTISI